MAAALCWRRVRKLLPASVAPPVQVPEPPPLAEALAPAPDQNLVTDARGIAAAQRMLILLGYDLKADGVMGPATRKAIISFQKDHAMAEDGRLTISLVDRLKIMTAELSRPGMATVAVGDALFYSDGSMEVAPSAKSVPWEPRKGSRALVAARPATAGWPAEARAGLDWAVTHALDMPGPAVDWSSTGVNARFEIRTYAALTPRERHWPARTHRPVIALKCDRATSAIPPSPALMPRACG
ncbi:MAG: peptidoglycan-binding domain-containing protein [Alphaproteobacteria bacterium]